MNEWLKTTWCSLIFVGTVNNNGLYWNRVGTSVSVPVILRTDERPGLCRPAAVVVPCVRVRTEHC